MAMTSWSTTAANNVLANTGINMDEGMAPSAVNDGIREIMAVLKTSIDTGSLTATGTTFNLVNATATTLNIGGAATTINIGAATGTLTVANTTLAAKAITASTTLNVTGVATFTAQPILSSLTASLPVFSDGSKGLVSNAMTGTGNVMMSASPTTTGTLTAAAITASGAITANAGLVVGASQAITGTVANSTISGFLSVAATTGTFTNVGGTLSTAAQPNVTSLGTLAANLLFVDNTYDIGASSATRPRDMFLSRVLALQLADSDTVWTGAPFSMGASYVKFRVGTSKDFFIDTYNGGSLTSAFKLSQAGNILIPGSITAGAGSFTTGAFSGDFAVATSKFTVAAATGNTVVAGTLNVAGDVYTTVWTDYSSTSTVAGWAATPTVDIRYKKIGKTVFVKFTITGTSNATTCSFTVPSNIHANSGVFLPGGTCRDNGTLQTTPPYISLTASGNTIYIYKDMATNNFTTSGTKTVSGQFWYEEA